MNRKIMLSMFGVSILGSVGFIVYKKFYAKRLIKLDGNEDSDKFPKSGLYFLITSDPDGIPLVDCAKLIGEPKKVILDYSDDSGIQTWLYGPYSSNAEAMKDKSKVKKLHGELIDTAIDQMAN